MTGSLTIFILYHTFLPNEEIPVCNDHIYQNCTTFAEILDNVPDPVRFKADHKRMKITFDKPIQDSLNKILNNRYT